MQTYIALLPRINVQGYNKIKMTDLKTIALINNNNKFEIIDKTVYSFCLIIGYAKIKFVFYYLKLENYYKTC